MKLTACPVCLRRPWSTRARWSHPTSSRALWRSAPARRECPLRQLSPTRWAQGQNLAAEDHPDGAGRRWRGRGHGHGQRDAGSRASRSPAAALPSAARASLRLPLCHRSRRGGLRDPRHRLRAPSAARAEGARSTRDLRRGAEHPGSASGGATTLFRPVRAARHTQPPCNPTSLLSQTPPPVASLPLVEPIAPTHAKANPREPSSSIHPSQHGLSLPLPSLVRSRLTWPLTRLRSPSGRHLELQGPPGGC